MNPLLRHLTPPAALAAGLALAGCSLQPVNRPAEDLHALFDEAWEYHVMDDPFFAQGVGVHDYNDRLPDVSAAHEARVAEKNREFLDRLTAIARDVLDEEDRVSYDMFQRQTELAIADFEFRGYLLALTSETGFHMGFARLPASMPFRNTGDYDNYIARLKAYPEYTSDHVTLLRQAIAEGLTIPRVVLDGYESTITAHIVDDPQESVFWEPLERFPGTLPDSERERIRSEVSCAIVESVVPGYEAFLVFMTEEYIPAARTTLGASELPDGSAYYQHLIREYTTLDLSAEEIHALGLAEVARIRTQMDGIIQEVGFAGSFADFLEFLRTDPQFYAKTPEELLSYASTIAKEIDGKLPSMFSTLPRMPYGVAPVPAHIAPKYTAGRYIGAPVGGTRAGFYWVNTYDLPSRPLYSLTALTLHEAVPGHHLQHSLRQELTNLPDFRRFSSNSAFGEGWGLYSEFLGVEAGMYKTPYDRFGRLTYEMWRACRLVVDTGIHTKGWTRDQAMQYMAENTALSLHEIMTETDRYISWPGQALAYKLGELKIKELRAMAEEALGENFDLREFHHVVLQNGAIPLTVLEEQVLAWVEREASS